MNKRYENKVALVTGSASGIGRGVALAFAAGGASVVVSTDANLAGAEETVNLIKSAGGEAIYVKCDVRIESDVRSMVAAAVDAYGKLDCACNNASVGPDGVRIPLLNIADTPEEIWDKTLDVNLKGAFLCMKHEIIQMTKQGTGGAIVNVSSIGALSPLPGFSAYSSSKAGLNILTRVAAIEAAKDGIRVNAIMPCPTERTKLLENLQGTTPEMKDHMADNIPLGRPATPEDMASAVLWLCSDDASMITAHSLPVDGGMS